MINSSLSVLNIRLLGYRIGQIRLVFSFQPRTLQYLFPTGQQPLKHLAYVEWFKISKSTPQQSHLLYQVSRSLDRYGDRLASIIPVDAIRRSVHLFPQFGPVASRDWTSDNVLEHCQNFYINCFSDRHSYHTII